MRVLELCYFTEDFPIFMKIQFKSLTQYRNTLLLLNTLNMVVSSITISPIILQFQYNRRLTIPIMNNEELPNKGITIIKDLTKVDYINILVFDYVENAIVM